MDEADHERVREALNRVLGSENLKSAPALRSILKYVVDEELAGRGSSIKAFTIGMDALGKSDSFDPQTDPSVRVNFGRLRTALYLYYETLGNEDPIRIEIPKGSYRPRFSVNDFGSQNNEIELPVSQAQSRTQKRPPLFLLIAVATILLLGSLYFLSSDNFRSGRDVAKNSIGLLVSTVPEIPEGDKILSESFARDLRVAISRNPAFSVVLDSNTSEARDDIDYRVTAVAKNLNDNNRFTIELINNHTSQLVWARNYDVADVSSVTDKVTRELFTHIFGDSKEALEGRDPKTLTAQQLTLMATWVSGPATNALNWETERAELARLAISKDPNYGPAYSVLADKLSYLGSVDGPSDTQAASQEAAASRLKALELSPRDPNAMFNVAQSYWHSGNVLEAVRAMKRVLEIDPNRALARFFASAIPYTCKPAPDEALQTAIDFDASLSPDNPVRWVTLTWIGWLHFNRDEYEQALEAEKRSAQIFQIPYTVMRHAAILSKLGRNDEAAELLRSQKNNWPNLSPDHFADKTMPKLCKDFPGETKMIGFYKSLAESMQGRL